jgi:hypothetical protein
LADPPVPEQVNVKVVVADSKTLVPVELSG